jgi:hypothetical protein
MNMRSLAFVIAVGAVIQSGVAVSAQAVSDWGHILWFETGWAVDSMSVMLDVPQVDPTDATGAKCPITNAGYALDPQDPGLKAHEAAIMGAYFAGKRVRIRADGCVFQKPRIIAVAVQD